ncbi:PleD family two-component system response regulator [Methylocapsa sp. S129]|uniref:PleD family two-component system response regulator n=1 Tax=Methylocapsa sp. S129 TaxID=1641869 RepID=UPI00131D245F|nr:PleD family two-component system response regulator [Methylocapsa sp. S129]
MTARILVVDDIPPNVKLLEARLSAEYFDVLTAANGPEALGICAEGSCDIVLLDVMMPGMDGFEVCRRIKNNPATAHLPVVMVTALDQPADRVRGLEAGADDFLTKPIDEVALVARVKSLARLKVVIDELRSGASKALSPGAREGAFAMTADDGKKGRILLVDDRASSSERIVQALSPHHEVTVETDAHRALFKAAEDDCDLFVVSLGLENYDGLRLCSQIRSLERTRNLPILAIAEADDRTRVLRALDLGVNDYLARPIDRNELLARAQTQLRHKRYADSLRNKVQQSIELALVDPLTGLNNRRFLETHLATMLDQAQRRRAPLSLMIFDIDHFKNVNDTHGHDCGDEVLKGFADRLRGVIRGGDLLCRLGGEEFVIVMPNSSLEIAAKVAERTRSAIQEEPFVIDSAGRTISITVSIGIAGRGPDSDPDSLYRRADRALYRSKSEGRNRVTADAA